MTSIICTLFEGDYHFGLAALVNSLCRNGYKGTIFAGFRGPLPPWANASENDGEANVFKVSGSVGIRFLPLKTGVHLTNYKPQFMMDVWERECPEATNLFYFDPDIVILCRWSFFEEWLQAGVAVCQDVNGWMPDNHPIRHAWRRLLAPRGFVFDQRFDAYFNAGFVGVIEANAGFLQRWQKAIDEVGLLGADLGVLNVGDRSAPITFPDQDALNIACMTAGLPISSVGQDGMDFQWGGGGYIMSHAVGGLKPWRKRFTMEALVRAIGPSRADKAFMQNVGNPIRPFSEVQFNLKKADIMLASAFSRYLC